MQQEPSVLDFLKSYIGFTIKRLYYSVVAPGKDIEKPVFSDLPADDVGEPSRDGVTASYSIDDVKVEVSDLPETRMDIQSESQSEKRLPDKLFRIPWRSIAALVLGLLAQGQLELRADRTWLTGAVMYVVALGLLLWGNLSSEWSLSAWKVNSPEGEDETRPFHLSSRLFLIGLIISLIAFLNLTNNLFTESNVFLWLLALLMMSLAFWNFSQTKWLGQLRDFIARPHWDFRVTRWTLLVVAGLGLSVFFRTYLLNEIPSQMISDQAEKLWDVRDVLGGITSIFFTRNTGREFFQFYLTAGIIKLFDTGITFLSLKIGTVFAGLFAVVYMYFLGKEVANRRVGLLAMVFTGIAYWPNIISRYGLRFPFYPMFYAPALYYLVRALKRRTQNDFVLCGLFVGLGLNGYSPYRVVPIVLMMAIGLYLLHKQSKGHRNQAIWGLVAVGVVSSVIFLPLLKYMTENPDAVLWRAMTRIGTWERPLPGPVWQIFLQNLWNGLVMFGWNNGEVWAISIPHRPALDVVSAALFYLGALLVIVRYVRQRNWFDIFTLVSIPVLMLPSILSLAFPAENPSLNRPAGVIIPVFLIIGMALDGLMTAIESTSTRVRKYRFSWLLLGLLLFMSVSQNYDLVFNQYRSQYELSSWNTTELGSVVRGFVEETGSVETAYLVGYPYWVDSRLVMINAGFPDLDNAIWTDQLKNTLEIKKPKLFLINIADTASVEALRALYPSGWLQEYKSKFIDKNFLMFFTVSPNSNP